MEAATIAIDGSMGEGGGQVLRSALALSMALGKPFHMSGIRGKRPKPGLKRQHLTCVRAAQAICGAEVSGDAMHSAELTFIPGTLRPGDYEFHVGTGGSVTLVLQALLPPLLTASALSRITVTGGTHVPHAPPFEFMERTLFPCLERMGAKLAVVMSRVGYMDVGGGAVSVEIVPAGPLLPFAGKALGAFEQAGAAIYCHNLPPDVAEREEAVLLAGSGTTSRPGICRIRRIDGSSGGVSCTGAGNAVLVSLFYEGGEIVLGEIGWRGRSAETVARHAVRRATDYMCSGAQIERHLADQLLVPMALAGGGSFIAETVTPHTKTCLDVITLFTGLKAEFTSGDGKGVRITLGAAPGDNKGKIHDIRKRIEHAGPSQ